MTMSPVDGTPGLAGPPPVFHALAAPPLAFLIALGYFFNKHAYKLQADYRQLETDIPAGGSVTNDEFRLQYQLIF